MKISYLLELEILKHFSRNSNSFLFTSINQNLNIFWDVEIRIIESCCKSSDCNFNIYLNVFDT